MTTVEPPQEGERRAIVRRTGAVAQVMVAWPRPGAQDPGFYPFDVLASILGDGLSARLHQALVETRLATSASAANWAFADPFLFMLNATVSDGVDPAKVEAELRKVVETVRASGVTEEEVARAKAQLEAQQAFAREGTYGTAMTLGEAIAAKDWEWWVDYLDRIRAVTPGQVQEAAKKWLGPDQLTVGWFVPKKEEGEAAGGGAGQGPVKGARAGAADEPPGRRPAPERCFAAWSPPPGPGRGAGPAFGSHPLFATGGGAGPFQASRARPRRELPTAMQRRREGTALSREAAGLPLRSGRRRACGAQVGAAGGSGARGFAQRTTRRVLPNGAVLLLLPNELSETVSVRVRLRAGQFLDGNRHGLAEATAGMLGRGTKSRKKLEIARSLESVGSSLYWDADLYDVSGAGACLSKNLPELLRTIVEELREPAFDAGGARQAPERDEDLDPGGRGQHQEPRLRRAVARGLPPGAPAARPDLAGAARRARGAAARGPARVPRLPLRGGQPRHRPERDGSTPPGENRSWPA